MTYNRLHAVISALFARPADTVAYAVGDLVANSTAAGAVAPLALAGAARIRSHGGEVIGVRLTKTGVSVANAQFRVHLFKLAPVVAGGDNAALAVNGRAAVHIGYADVTLDQVFTDGAKGAVRGIRIGYDCADTRLYALIEARAAYVPLSAESFTLALEVVRD